jgi:hypothetical protein
MGRVGKGRSLPVASRYILAGNVITTISGNVASTSIVDVLQDET